MNKLRIVIADDHAIVRFGLSSLLNAQPDLKVVAQAKNGEDAITRALETRPDLVVMDLMMPKMDGAAATEKIHRLLPDTKIVLLTSFGAYEGVARALRNGAVGAIAKSTEDEMLVPALRRIAAGETVISPEIQKALEGQPALGDLTERQREILEALTRGLGNQEIAALLGIRPETVRDHLSEIFEKIGASNRTEAVSIAFKRHLLS